MSRSLASLESMYTLRFSLERAAASAARQYLKFRSVAGFPYCRGDHIARRNVALLGVAGIDVHATLFLGARGGQRGQVILELPICSWISILPRGSYSSP